MASASHRHKCIRIWSVFPGLLTLSQWAVCTTMDALASPLLGCIGDGLSHFP